MPKGYLIAQRGNVIGNRYKLKNGQTSLGRNPDNDVVLEEVAVSRYHAVVKFDSKSGEITVMDLGSTNGVTVNNTEIKKGVAYKVQHRDTVFVGRVVFSVQIGPDDYSTTNIRVMQPDDQDRTGHLNLPVRYRRKQTDKLNYATLEPIPGK